MVKNYFFYCSRTVNASITKSWRHRDQRGKMFFWLIKKKKLLSTITTKWDEWGRWAIPNQLIWFNFQSQKLWNICWKKLTKQHLNSSFFCSVSFLRCSTDKRVLWSIFFSYTTKTHSKHLIKNEVFFSFFVFRMKSFYAFDLYHRVFRDKWKGSPSHSPMPEWVKKLLLMKLLSFDNLIAGVDNDD